MTLEIAALFGTLAVMAVLFLTERLPIELTAFLGLVGLTLGGLIHPDEAFVGFASPAVITMLSMFFLGAALQQTGIADWIGARTHGVVGSRETALVLAVMLMAGCLSAFMNNVAAAAVLMPAVASIARRTGVPPSRLFMPLAFGVVLGGTTTLVGTPPNIVSAEMLASHGLEPFRLFDFAPIGIPLLVTGTLLVVFAGRRMLPARSLERVEAGPRDLVHVYHLQEAFFSIRIPDDSRLDGVTLRKSRFGSTLGVQVVSLERAGRRRPAPSPDTVLRGGDVLLVHGGRSDIEELFRVQGVELVHRRPIDLPRASRSVLPLSVRIPSGSPFAGRTLRDLRFRETYGLVAVGIVREEKLLDAEIARVALREGDEILAVGRDPNALEEGSPEEVDIDRMPAGRIRSLLGHLFFLRIPEGSALAGLSLEETRFGELVGLTAAGIVRGDAMILPVEPSEVLRAGDELVVVGEPQRIRDLLAMGKVELQEDPPDTGLESEEIGVIEAAIAPRSHAAGRTLAEIQFREKHGLQALAVWREGRPIHTSIGALRLRFGDALLLQGPWRKIRLLAGDPDFLVLSPEARGRRRTRKAPFALGGVILFVLLVVTGLQPVHVAAFTAGTLVLLSGAITMEEAYRAVEWRVLFLVAAILPVGYAMDRTGAAALLANAVESTAAPFGPRAVLAGMCVLSSVLSQTLDGTPAVVILIPVALRAAESMHISPYPLLMGVTLGASAAFMTPFSQKANLLVMGAGGYRTRDYLRVGTPLTLLFLVLLVVLVPLLYPL